MRTTCEHIMRHCEDYEDFSYAWYDEDATTTRDSDPLGEYLDGVDKHGTTVIRLAHATADEWNQWVYINLK